MRITALVKSHDHVCCRYRVGAYCPHLEALGHQVDIRPWSTGWFLQQLFPAFSPSYDALIVQRRLLPAWQLRRLRARVRWLIYDFDDSVFLRSSFNPLGRDCPKRFEQFRAMVQTADAVIAGNDFLREQAEALTEPNKVVTIPTCLDVERYPLAQHSSSARVKLAWIGSSSTLRGLERIRGLLDQLGARLPELELRLICDHTLQTERLPINFRPWSRATETHDLAGADIGISWLPPDDWSAGKCGLKVLQYMAAGLPVVANPVGMHLELIEPGVTGVLARTLDEWHEAVAILARNAELRRRMGAAGRRRVERGFRVEHGAAAWERVLQDLESKPRGEAQEVKPRGEVLRTPGISRR